MELFAKVVGARVGAKPTGTVRVHWVLSLEASCSAWVKISVDFLPYFAAKLTLS